MRTDPRTNQASMFMSVHRQVSKWKRQQTGMLADLTKEKHFDIRVHIGNKDECVPVISCLLCHRKCGLGSKNGSVSISNWTRHVNKCYKQFRPGKTPKLSTFVVSSESALTNFSLLLFPSIPPVTNSK